MSEELKVAGLTNLEFRELEKILGKENVTKLPSGMDGHVHREPGLIAASIILTSFTFTALTIILSQKKEKSRRDIIFRRVKNAETEILEMKLSEVYEKSSPPDKEVIEQMAKAFKVDVSALGAMQDGKEEGE